MSAWGGELRCMKMFTRPLLSGIGTGLFLHLAVGPVFFYVFTIALQSSGVAVWSAIAGVTLADCLYIALSMAAVGRSLVFLKRNRSLQLISPVILFCFGIALLYHGTVSISGHAGPAGLAKLAPCTVFISTFLLTVSSPMTILFWTGLFSSKAVENNYKRRELICFGTGAALSTVIFFSLTMSIILAVQAHIPLSIFGVFNCLVGIVLAIYGIRRAAAAFPRKAVML